MEGHGGLAVNLACPLLHSFSWEVSGGFTHASLITFVSTS